MKCYANDEREHEDLKKRKHPNLKHDETCHVAVHVGCARWGGLNHFGVRRAYFFAGDEKRDDVFNIFCTLHAEDVDYAHLERLKLERERIRNEQQLENERRRLEGLRNAPSREDQVLEAQRLIANQRNRAQNANSSSRRGNSRDDSQRDSKRRKQEQEATSDSDDDEGEFEFEG